PGRGMAVPPLPTRPRKSPKGVNRTVETTLAVETATGAASDALRWDGPVGAGAQNTRFARLTPALVWRGSAGTTSAGVAVRGMAPYYGGAMKRMAAMKRTTVMLPEALRRRAAFRARQRGISLGELIRDSLDAALPGASYDQDPLFEDVIFDGP